MVSSVCIQRPSGLPGNTTMDSYTRGLPAPLHSSVRQVPVLVKPQCMLSRNLGYPSRTSVQRPLGQQNFSAH
jgi:hypothetical protein